MRLPRFLVATMLALAAATTCSAALPAAPANEAAVAIQIDPTGFAGTNPETLTAVLRSVADSLLARDGRHLAIRVSHTNGNPIALYDRGPADEHLVRLHASGSQWHLYVYEFAHELCHVASNHDLHVGEDTVKRNQWFEEALCETASLYALKTLADVWRQSPPAPELAGQDRNLARFLDLLLSEPHRRPPADVSMAEWLRQNEHLLRRDPYRRDMNDRVANQLLPLFLKDSGGWRTLAYLNLDPADLRDDLPDYLRHWHDNTPATARGFVSQVLRLFAIDSREEPTRVADASTARR